MSILGPDRKRWYFRILIYILVGIGFMTLCILQIAASEMLAVTAPEQSAEAIRVLEDSIGLLKWVGGGIVSGLVTAVALLYRALEKANAQLRADLLAGLGGREDLMKQSLEASARKLEAITRLTDRVETVGDEVKDLVKRSSQPCPFLRKSEEG